MIIIPATLIKGSYSIFFMGQGDGGGGVCMGRCNIRSMTSKTLNFSFVSKRTTEMTSLHREGASEPNISCFKINGQQPLPILAMSS